MPKRTRKIKRSVSKTSAPVPVHFFTRRSFILELIIIAFLAVSALLITYIVNQQEELSLYRSAQADSLQQ